MKVMQILGFAKDNLDREAKKADEQDFNAYRSGGIYCGWSGYDYKLGTFTKKVIEVAAKYPTDTNAHEIDGYFVNIYLKAASEMATTCGKDAEWAYQKMMVMIKDHE